VWPYNSFRVALPSVIGVMNVVINSLSVSDRIYCRCCRRVGHQESDECRRSYAQTAAVEEPEPELHMDQDEENADDDTVSSLSLLPVALGGAGGERVN